MTATTDEETKIILTHLHANFVRNYATRKAIVDNYKKLPSNNLWRIISNSCLDIAVINWCSLFGSKSETTHWKKCNLRGITDIESQVFNTCSITQVDFDKLHAEITDYRNRAVAHIDINNWRVDVPFMQKALNVINASCVIFCRHNSYAGLYIEQEYDSQYELTMQLINAYIATSPN